MKFQTNTKPFADALALGIINSNVSNFHKKSCIVQLSATSDTLKINIEASMICTEMKLKGAGEGDPATVFVDSMLLKQLASTLESATIILEFTDGGLIIHSGKHKFSLAKMLDSSEFELRSPAAASDTTMSLDIDKSDWKFMKDYQMYAISMTFVHPVYTRAWVGDNGDVLVGDYDSSLFTYSKKSKLGATCLLQDSIINLFNSLPDGAKLMKSGRDYIIHISNDSFEYTTQFTPEYEDDENIGSYNADIFLSMMTHPDSFIQVNVAALTKLLNQALLLSSTSEDTIKWAIKDKLLHLTDRNVDGSIPVEVSGASAAYEIDFKLTTLKQVIANYPDETISISPMMQEDEAAGILIWNKDLTTAVAGVE